MTHTIARGPLAALTLLLLAGSTGGAAAIPSYTITDLGVGAARVSPPTGADATLTSPDGGTTYAFPRTDNQVSNPEPLLDSFPPFTNAPVWNTLTYGNPKNAYSYFNNDGVFLNKEGVFAATDLYGVSSHFAGAGSTVYSATRRADGTFGPLVPLWGSPNNRYEGLGPIARVLDMNNAHQLLGVTANVDFPTNGAYLLHDLTTGRSTDLQSLLGDWHLDYATLLDDRGRILVTADLPPDYRNQNARVFEQHALLLTPAGLTSDPIPTPEPSALATMAVAALGVAYRRYRQR
jgi:hypothetical protein